MISTDTLNNDTNDSLETLERVPTLGTQVQMLKYKLYGENGPSKGISIDIAPPSITIGRAKACDLPLNSSHIDPIAVHIFLDEDTLSIKSESLEPILINRSVIPRDEVISLQVGDVIQVDVFKLCVGLIEEEDAIAPTPEDTLDRVTALNSQESSTKVWITKPTSPGNREHDVPDRPPLVSVSTIATVVAAAVLIVGLSLIALSA